MTLLPFYVDDIIKTALTEDINYKIGRAHV